MHARIVALSDEYCPKCGAVSVGTKAVVFRVADERGAGYECDACAHYWRVTQNNVVVTAKDVRI